MELEIQHSLEVLIANWGYFRTFQFIALLGGILYVIFWELGKLFARLLYFAFFKGYKSEKTGR